MIRSVLALCAVIASPASAVADAVSAWRHVQQVVVTNQKDAEIIAARARAGESLTSASAQFGVSGRDIDVGDITEAEFARISSPAIAQVVFSIPSGSVIGPMKTSIGWHVIVTFRPAVEPARP